MRVSKEDVKAAAAYIRIIQKSRIIIPNLKIKISKELRIFLYNEIPCRLSPQFNLHPIQIVGLMISPTPAAAATCLFVLHHIKAIDAALPSDYEALVSNKYSQSDRLKIAISLPIQRLKRNTLFVDVLSVKEFPKDIFLQVLPTHLCTHPMFGLVSGKDSWKGLDFVFDKVRIGEGKSKADKFLDIFEKKNGAGW
ncbi:hypothetical protein H5410_005265 [Solanum commersonii]|uniref:Uncharacterized protein n=1 Tax=Solanum commersonii TaxID=4109 RepID=A0A9J6A7P0_SOLCO|nr:hypothetical protein H5410_005265 [Solanum commersonii]